MNIRLSQAALSLGIFLFIGNIVLAITYFYSTEQTRVGGTSYRELAALRDLRADVLPPPLYLVDAHNLVLRIEAKPERVTELASDLKRLHTDYNQRLAFWTERKPSSELANIVFGSSDAAAQRFWSLAESQILPAAKSGDAATLSVAGEEIEQAYLAHRKAIDELIPLISAARDRAESDALAKLNASRTLMRSMLLAMSIASMGALWLLYRRIIKPIQGISAYTTNLAAGNFQVEVPYQGRHDEVGEIAKSLEGFRLGAIERQAQRREQEELRETAAREREAYEAKTREADEMRRDVVAKLAQGLSQLSKVGAGARLNDTFSTEYEQLRLDFNGAVDALEALALEQKIHEESLQAADRVRTDVVNKLASGLAEVAAGRLTVRLSEAFPADFEQLRRDFNAAVEALDLVLWTISTSTNNVDRAARDIAIAADDLARRTEQQSASLGETSAAFEELTTTVGQTATVAQEARQFVAETKENANKSGIVVRQAVAAMGEIEESSKQISQIIGVIDEIAFQTNLLALNAGVEAARAGEAGRGFAVVASEVRALAQRSADAAKEIKGLITTSEGQVGNGVNHVSQAGKALGEIVDQVTRIDALITNIAASAQKQASALSQVNVSINHIDQATQQNAGMVEKTTISAHAMRQDAGALSEQIAGFSTSRAKAEHTASTSNRSTGGGYGTGPATDDIDLWNVA